MGARAREAIEDYLARRSDVSSRGSLEGDGRPLFISRRGTRISRRQIQRSVGAWLAWAAEGENLSVHALRHTFATHMLDEGADLMAVKELLGHSSLSTTRVYTHTSRDRLVKAYQQVPIGDPLDEATLMGPLVNERAVEDMMAALETAQAQGGEILTGGRALADKGACFAEPTIVAMPEQTPLVCEETFAPILYLMEYETLDEAIAIHNGVPQGLSSAIFTTNLLTAESFLAATGSDCGIANVNIGTSGAEIGGAFGGEKETGGGRESGSDAWKGYMRRQTTTINWSTELPLAQGIQFG